MDNKDKAVSSTEQLPQKITYTIPISSELRVRGLSQDSLRRLTNVAKWQGVSVSSLVKLHIKDILAGYPSHFQNDPPLKD